MTHLTAARLRHSLLILRAGADGLRSRGCRIWLDDVADDFELLIALALGTPGRFHRDAAGVLCGRNDAESQRLGLTGGERAAANQTEKTMESTTPKLEDRVRLTMTEERGVIIGVATYAYDKPEQYLVRYKAADGRQVEAWFDGAAIVVVLDY